MAAGQFQMLSTTSSHTQITPVMKRAHSSGLIRSASFLSASRMSIVSAGDLRLPVLTRLVHVADSSFVKQNVGIAVASYLDAAPVVPFDRALHLLAIFHHDDHGSFTLNLLLVV